MFLQGLNGHCFDVSGIGQVPEPYVCGGPGRPCPVPPPAPGPPPRGGRNVGEAGQRRFRGLARQISRLLPQVEAAFQREMRGIVTRQLRLARQPLRPGDPVPRRFTCQSAHREALMAALNRVRGAMRAFRAFFRYEFVGNVPFRSYLARFTTRFPALYFAVG